MEFLEEYGAIAIAALLFIAIVQFIMLISTNARVKKLTKKYNAMVNGQGVDDLESVISHINTKINEHSEHIKVQEGKIESIIKQQPLHKNKISITRYNAFAETGSDLSFSVAIVNEHKDGIVITGIHGREGGYIYGKPIEKGQSKYSLTPEEIKVINEAK